ILVVTQSRIDHEVASDLNLILHVKAGLSTGFASAKIEGFDLYFIVARIEGKIFAQAQTHQINWVWLHFHDAIPVILCASNASPFFLDLAAKSVLGSCRQRNVSRNCADIPAEDETPSTHRNRRWRARNATSKRLRLP